mgnify:CR=1 FL=1
MAEKDKPNIKFCVYCGEKLKSGEVYCPNCGKLVVKAKSGQSSKPLSPNIRKCPNCGSLIESDILKECPVCRTKLREPPHPRLDTSEQRKGLVFTDEKLEPEENFVVRRENWKLKEGMSVLYTSIFFYFILLSFFIFFPLGENILSIVIFTASEIVIGLYPIWYIFSNGHSLKKLGFITDSKSLILAFLIGIAGVFVMLYLDWILGFFVGYLADIFGVTGELQANVNIIESAEYYWIILLLVLNGFTALSKEILFRGVLHNTLIERFGNDLKGKVIVISIVALAYSILFMLFRFPLGLISFLPYFVITFTLGIIYELSSKNLFSTITAFILYNIGSLIILLIL